MASGALTGDIIDGGAAIVAEVPLAVGAVVDCATGTGGVEPKGEEPSPLAATSEGGTALVTAAAELGIVVEADDEAVINADTVIVA